jgi:hypothetical protein
VAGGVRIVGHEANQINLEPGTVGLLDRVETLIQVILVQARRRFTSRLGLELAGLSARRFRAIWPATLSSPFFSPNHTRDQYWRKQNPTRHDALFHGSLTSGS